MGRDEGFLHQTAAGVYSLKASDDDSVLTLSAGASLLLDKAMNELDRQARLPERSLWHFASIQSIPS